MKKSLTNSQNTHTHTHTVIDRNVHLVIEQDLMDNTNFKDIEVDILDNNLTKAHAGITARAFLNKVTALDRFFFNFDRDYMQQLFNQSSKSPDHMTQAYEVVSSMQIMYCNALSLAERWTVMLKKWLLNNLKVNISLPVQRPDLLMSVVDCLNREKMLKSSSTIREVENCIEWMFSKEEVREGTGGGGGGVLIKKSHPFSMQDDNNEDGEDDTEKGEVKQLLSCVKSMIDTLNCVVDDLLPMLPSNFNVLALFQKAAEKRIQMKIGVFYASNKDKLDVDELLTLLSWADNHKHVMARFGVRNVSSDFTAIEMDLYDKYSKQVQGLQLEWQERILKNESHFLVSSKSDGSKMSNWPEDLMVCVGGQLDLAVSRLQGKNLSPICCLCIETIDTFKVSLEKKFEKEKDEMSVEEFCSFANDCYRFADLLQEQMCMLDSLDEEAEDEVGDKMGELIMHFSELSSAGLKCVVGVMSTDIENELRDAMVADDSR